MKLIYFFNIALIQPNNLINLEKHYRHHAIEMLKQSPQSNKFQSFTNLTRKYFKKKDLFLPINKLLLYIYIKEGKKIRKDG